LATWTWYELAWRKGVQLKSCVATTELSAGVSGVIVLSGSGDPPGPAAAGSPMKVLVNCRAGDQGPIADPSPRARTRQKYDPLFRVVDGENRVALVFAVNTGAWVKSWSVPTSRS